MSSFYTCNCSRLCEKHAVYLSFLPMYVESSSQQPMTPSSSPWCHFSTLNPVKIHVTVCELWASSRKFDVLKFRDFAPLARIVWHDVQQNSDENIKALSVAVEFDIMKSVSSLREDIYANWWSFPSYDTTGVIFKQTSCQWIGLRSVFGCCRAWWYPLLVLPILHHCCPSQMDLLPYQEVALLPSGTTSLASVALTLSPLIILDPSK